MKNKNVTMKDIAEKLNLSLSTVSYVLNYSTKEKISHDTRIKVLDAAREMGYIPNIAAKSLAGKQSRLVGIIAGRNDQTSLGREYVYYDMIKNLQACLNHKNYDVILLPYDPEQLEANNNVRSLLAATFVIDADQDTFHRVSRCFYSPVIILDSLIEDRLFFKILPDYREAIKVARNMLKTDNPYAVIDRFTNKNLIDYLAAEFAREDVFINNRRKDIHEFLNRMKNRKGIFIGDNIEFDSGLILRKESICFVGYGGLRKSGFPFFADLSLEKLCEKAVDLMEHVMKMSLNSGENDIVILKN